MQNGSHGAGRHAHASWGTQDAGGLSPVKSRRQRRPSSPETQHQLADDQARTLHPHAPRTRPAQTWADAPAAQWDCLGVSVSDSARWAGERVGAGKQGGAAWAGRITHARRSCAVDALGARCGCPITEIASNAPSNTSFVGLRVMCQRRVGALWEHVCLQVCLSVSRLVSLCRRPCRVPLSVSFHSSFKSAF